MSNSHKRTWAAGGVAVLLPALAWIAALPQLGGPGLTWDEAYYYPTFRAVAHWTLLIFDEPALAFSREGIDAGWEEIHELPPVVKWLGAAFSSFGAEGWWRLGLLRLFPAICHGVTLWLMFLVARRMMRGWWALLPVVVYALHPRVAGHAQIAATETVFAFVTMLTAWVALQDLRRWGWRLALAACLGLALATKVNGLILIGAVVVWLLLKEPLKRPRKFQLRKLKSPLLAIALMLVVAPVLALAVWPWMWHNTAARLAEYWAFISEHSHQGVWFMGAKWNFGGPPAPVYFPFVMLHVTTPVVALGLFWTGLLAILIRFLQRLRIDEATLLMLGLMTAPLLAA